MRLALISDIHEDVVSLRLVLAKIDQLGCDQLICLGDISGYSVPYYSYQKDRSAHDSLNMLRGKSCIMISGNHDYHAAKKIPQNSKVFDFPENWYELDHKQRKGLAGEEIWLHEENELDPLYTHEDIEFLRTLPEYLILKADCCNILLTHYVYPNLAGFKRGFYIKGEEFKQHFDFMNKLECSVSFIGHAHTSGFYSVVNGQFRHHRLKKSFDEKSPLCIGIPPVSNNSKRRGFCMFDTVSLTLTPYRV